MITEVKKEKTEKVEAAPVNKEPRYKSTSTECKAAVYNLVGEYGDTSKRYILKDDTIVVTNENGKKSEKKIRYIQGAPSIYVSEQGELENDGSMILFEAGSLVVEADNILLQEFLDARNDNESNKSRKKGVHPVYYKFDPEAEAKEKTKEFDILANAMTAYAKMNFEERKVIARNIDSIKSSVSSMEPSEITHAVQVLLKAHPEKFLAIVDDAKSEIKSNILEALELNIIRESGHSILWTGEDGGHILSIPPGKPIINYVADWIAGGDGKIFYGDIVTRLTKAKK